MDIVNKQSIRTVKKRTADGKIKIYHYTNNARTNPRKHLEIAFENEAEKLQFEKRIETLQRHFGCKRKDDVIKRLVFLNKDQNCSPKAQIQNHLQQPKSINQVRDDQHHGLQPLKSSHEHLSFPLPQQQQQQQTQGQKDLTAPHELDDKHFIPQQLQPQQYGKQPGQPQSQQKQLTPGSVQADIHPVEKQKQLSSNSSEHAHGHSQQKHQQQQQHIPSRSSEHSHGPDQKQQQQQQSQATFHNVTVDKREKQHRATHSVNNNYHFIGQLSSLVSLTDGICKHQQQCSEMINVSESRMIGYVCVIVFTCSAGHTVRWASEKMVSNNNEKVYGT